MQQKKATEAENCSLVVNLPWDLREIGCRRHNYGESIDSNGDSGMIDAGMIDVRNPARKIIANQSVYN